jgi:glycine cleavage system H protein
MDLIGMFFTKDHEWVRPDPEGDAGDVVIGITEYAAGELGDIIFIELPEPGAEFEAGETIGTIEAVKTVADLFAPVSGKITEINTQLEDQPELVNSSPFADGWFMKIKPSDPGELEKLMDHETYQQMIGEA